MAYREYPAPPALRRLVECGWSNEPRADGVAILPDGCMDLLWTGDRLLVAGPDTAPNPYRPVAGGPAVGLRFRSGRLPALLGVPAAAVRDLRVPLTELAPRLGRSATARLERGDSPAAVLAVLATTLPGAPPGPAVAAVVERIRRGGSATEAADALGWTTRSLHRRCLDWFGYGPSTLRRILRFRRAAAMLRAGVAIAEVAARTGYADQPHLSREVRALAGASPRALAAVARGSGQVGSEA